MAEYMMTTLLQVSIAAAVMIGVVLLVRAAVGMRIKAGLMSALWLMVLVRLVLPVTIDSPFNVTEWMESITPRVSAETPAETAETADTGTAPLAFETNPTTTTHSEVSPAEAVTAAAESPAVIDFLKTHLYHGLLAVWLVGAAVFFAVTGNRMRKFRRHIKSSHALNAGWISAAALSYKLWLGIRRDIRVVESHLVDVPVVMGVFHPVIILPKGLAEALDREKLKVILLHEICHVKRCDLFKNALWLAAKGLHWFNPMVWAAYKAYLEDTEQACDAMVLGALNESAVIVYSEALVAVMRQAKGCAVIPAYVSFCRNSSHLRKRVTNMLKPKKKPAAVSALVMILMMVLAVGCFTTACMKDTGKADTENLSVVQMTAPVSTNAAVSFSDGLTMQVVSATPLIEVVPENLTIEQLNILIDAFAGGYPVYTADGQTYDGSQESAERLMQAFDDDKILEVFVENSDGIEFRFELMQTMEGQRTQLTAYTSGGGVNGDGISGDNWASFTMYTGEDIADMEKSFADCLTEAERFAKSLDGQDSNLEFDYALKCEGNSKPAYRIFFRRDYSGISVNSNIYSLAYKNDLNADGPQIVSTEEICVFVSDEGVIEMYWSEQYKQYTVVSENTALMDTDSIKNIFNNAAGDIRVGENHDIVPNITISRIELNYMIVKESDGATTDKIIPVWDFIGDVTHDGITEGDTILTHQENVCVMTINAINGEIIDR